ncbi:hypothetical protein JCM17843_07580 [Kordiimonadales bacterium JCM 17843]|nr:hypothetical protein JCM17843_07580 [Kordiimonadales bacterium JCM 17843]
MGNKELPLHWFALMAALWPVLFSPAKALADPCDPMMETTACAYQLLQKGQHEDAALFFERALEQEQNPKRRLQIALDLAHLYNNLGAYAKAAQTFQLAYALQPETQTLKALGFALVASGDVQAARVAFEKATKASPSDSFLHRQLGYLCRQLHDRACAIEQFKAAIDHEEDPDTTELLKREVRALSQTLWGSASLLWRTNATPGQELRFGDRVLSQSQGILEGNARIPLDLGSPDRWIAGFSRILWTIDGAAPTPHDESLQGGVGLKLKPFASQSIIIGVERLISLGAFSRDDWLFRASASKGAGFERLSGKKESRGFSGPFTATLPPSDYRKQIYNSAVKPDWAAQPNSAPYR